MIKKQIICMFLWVGLAGSVYSQPSQTNAFLPKLIPASPEAASLGKFGNYPVNMYTGVPDISIPLYEIQVGELRVPITLNYHASGIKVNDIPTWAGLGWTVSAGGSISRNVMSKPDEQPDNYLSGITVKTTSEIIPNQQASIDYLHGVQNGYIDVEPDIFSYSFPGKSGKFLFNQRDNFKPLIIPYDPLVIARTNITASTMHFDITDEGGVLHKFGAYEWTSTSSGSSNSNAISSWKLTQMISSNKKDTISFSYNERTGSGSTDYYFTEYTVVSDNIWNNAGSSFYSEDFGSTFNSHTFISTWWQLNNEILFKNGKVVFEQATEAREDFDYGLVMPKRLKSIKIYSYDNLTNTYKLIRTIQLNHSYFITGGAANTKRLRLDNIQIINAIGTEVEKYQFDYNTNQLLPERNSRAKDYWGYFNNAANNSLVPRMEVPFIGAGGSTTNIWIGSNTLNGREPDPNYMQACILKKITYPTGGYTEFEYETNKYIDQYSTVKNGGGIRIKKIRNYDGVEVNPIVKTYKYGSGESGYGRPNFVLNNYFFQNSQTNRFWDATQVPCKTLVGTKRVRTFLSNPTIDIEPYDASPVGYATVTEYIGDETNNTGKTIYEFNDRPDALNSVAGYGRMIITSYHYNRGQVTNKTVFKNIGSGQYKKVESTSNLYEYFAEQFIPYLGLAVFKWTIHQSQNSDNLSLGAPNGCGGYDDSYTYLYSNYSIRTGDNRLKETTSFAYDENDDTKFVSTNTKYYYDNFNHMQVTRVETTNSKNETLLTSKLYPHEKSAGAPYNAMVAANIINKVVEESTSNGSTPISKLTSIYTTVHSTNYVPDNIKLKIGTNTEETRAFFTKYNTRGSIQEMNKSDDVKMVYIWDYQGLYPVAEVVNASETEVAYTSFEGDGKGNWTYAGNVLTDPSAITGSRSYNLVNGAINKSSGLSGTSYYTVSYWTKNASAFTVLGTQGSVVAGPIVNGWKYFQHLIYGQTSVNISGTGFIDELRLYPQKAQMSTYTFEPLIGMTAKADINNRISYFEYDAAGRLKLIRDQNRNVRQVFCYNYAGQPVDCNSIHKNAAISQSFTRNNCGSGYTGSSVNYTVPYGTYVSTINQADADAKALADINLNGQDYANANGTCTPTVTMINIQGYNAKTVAYNVKFTNNSTGLSYTFLLNPYTFSPSYKGQVPAGTYSVQFYPAGTPAAATFNINGYTQYHTSGVTFYNISINATSTASMY